MTALRNKLQALFVDLNFTARFVEYYCKKTVYDFESNKEPFIKGNDWLRDKLQDNKYYFHNTFEADGADVSIVGFKQYSSAGFYRLPTLRIKIVDILGDDYPETLRDMHRNKLNVLFIHHYEGKGVTIANLKVIFHPKVIFFVTDI